MKPVKNDPQGIGSAITYGRRYGLSAIVGVCPADDDGNKASGKEGTIQTPPSLITEAQAETLRQRITETSTDLAKFLAWAKVANIGDLPQSRFGEAVKLLEGKKNPLPPPVKEVK